MTAWQSGPLEALSAAEEVQVVTTRRDGSERPPVTIWAVTDSGRVFLRSTNGPDAAWFRAALRTGRGTLIAAGTRSSVTFTAADPTDLATVDAAYRSKYRRYASIVDHLLTPEPRSATLQANPA